MDDVFYDMIFKRRSFHLFTNVKEKISKEELEKIEEFIKQVKPLMENIQIKIEIVPTNETTCKRGGEYCILFYSEKKDNYLQNIGYIGQQIDLFLPSMNIGCLWFGIGKVKEKIKDGLDYVIMIAIAKMDEDKFRKDMFKSKRKELSEVWKGEKYKEIGNITRFAPSACNTQPWITEEEENKLIVSRYKKPGKRGIMPASLVNYYNKIDIGIYMFILETCLKKNNMEFEREIYIDNGTDETEKNLNAIYKLK